MKPHLNPLDPDLYLKKKKNHDPCITPWDIGENSIYRNVDEIGKRKKILDPSQNLMGSLLALVPSFHHVSIKYVEYFLCNPADKQTNKHNI